LPLRLLPPHKACPVVLDLALPVTHRRSTGSHLGASTWVIPVVPPWLLAAVKPSVEGEEKRQYTQLEVGKE